MKLVQKITIAYIRTRLAILSAFVQPIISKNNPQLRFLITDGFGHRRIYREESVVKAVTEFL